MSITLGDVRSIPFATNSPSSGEATAATFATGYIYRQNNSNPLSIPVTISTTSIVGENLATFTLSGTGLEVGDNVHLSVLTIVEATSGVGIPWRDVITTGSSVVDNQAIAIAVNQNLTANHGVGLWVSGSGGSAIIDNWAIANAVDARLTANHGLGLWVSGTSSSGSGSGANPVTITVTDGTNPIPGAMVYTYNPTETSLIAYSTTSTLGVVSLLLDSGSYSVRLAKYATYTFTNPNVLVVSGATSATYSGTLIVPSPAPTPETCVVTGRVLNGQGYPVVNCKVHAEIIGNKVIFIDSQGNKTSIGSDPIWTETSATGTWALTLIRSSHLYQGGSTTGGVRYKILMKGRGMDETKDITVPDVGTAKYEEL